MELRLAVVFLAFVHASLTQGMQQFDREPQYTEANPGEIVIMSCRVFNKKGQCVWQKDGKPVGIYPGKYEWVSSPDLGDCSLRISAARADLDAGEWECQVTASSFDAQDALTSDPARLVVRVPPNPPQLELELAPMVNGSNLTLADGQQATVRCVSRGGNPAANVKWFLGETELNAGRYNQTNTTDIGKAKTWMAVSTLTYTFDKSHNRKPLRCVALHEAYPTKSRESSVTLDVHYAPTVKLAGAPSADIEENIDSVSLRCVADANPPATVIWRRVGVAAAAAAAAAHQPTTNKASGNSADIYSFQEALEFSPVTRKDSAMYSCEAKNTIGTSNLITVPLDVKYPPVIVNVGPAVAHQLTVTLYESARLECQADGNPAPRYQWLHRMKDGLGEMVIRSEDRYLHITNVTYEHQGEYICIASSTINGQERMVKSEAITLRVVGPPQVLNEISSRFLAVERGDDAIVRAVFCADPPPIRVSWRWASFQMEAGSGSGRFVADSLKKVSPNVIPTAAPTPVLVVVSSGADDESDSAENGSHVAAAADEPPANDGDADDDDELSTEPSQRDESNVENTHNPRSLRPAPKPSHQPDTTAHAIRLARRSPRAVLGTYPGKRDECYETSLRIQRVELNDARHYYLTVENDKGSDSFYVTLTVKEPVSMATVIAVVIACLFLILVVTLCLLYAYRSERCCFDRKGGSKSTDLESMKSDVESVHSSSQCSSSGTNSAASQSSIHRSGKGSSSSAKCSNHVSKSRAQGSPNSCSLLPPTTASSVLVTSTPSGAQYKTNIFVNGPANGYPAINAASATVTTVVCANNSAANHSPTTTTTATSTGATTDNYSATIGGETDDDDDGGFARPALRRSPIAQNK